MKKLTLFLLLTTIVFSKSYQEVRDEQFFKDAKEGFVYSLYHYQYENLNIQNKNGETPLIVAIKNNHPDVVIAFADGDVNVNIKDNSGKTAFDYINNIHLFSAFKYLEVLQIIKNKDKLISYSSKNNSFEFVLKKTSFKNYNFPKDVICHESKKEISRYIDTDYFLNLLKENPTLFYKIAPNYEPTYTQKDLEKEIKNSLFTSIRTKDNSIFDAIIDYVELKIKKDKSNYSILWAGIFYKNYYVISEILKRDIDMYEYDPMNLRTPLLWAIQTNDVKLLNLLIDNGINLDSTDKFGNPIIFKAFYKCKSFETIQIMIDKKVNLFNKNKHNQPVFDIEPVFCEKEDIDKMIDILNKKNVLKKDTIFINNK